MVQANEIPNSASMARILVVEDDTDLRLALVDSLSSLGYETCAKPSALDARQVLEQNDFDLVLTDVRMPGQSGIELCQYISGDRPGTPAVVMTAFGDALAAVDALRAGAVDFITKPFDMSRLAEAVARALQIRRKPSVTRIAASQPEEFKFEELVGSSPSMETLRRELAHAAKSDSNVLISGEAGSGKELLARALHSASWRRNERFVAVDCRAVSFETIEAELFAYQRGSAAGADAGRAGLFAEAANGTLFLDEVGDMPAHLQPKLMRALQARSALKIGAAQQPLLDVRIIASTSRNFAQLTQSGEFRVDLLRRIDVLSLFVPPLRKRQTDILELAKHFLSRAMTEGQVSGFELMPAAESLLLKYPWPGKVRELENCIKAAVKLARDRSIDVDALPEEVRRSNPRTKAAMENVSIEVVERRHIEAVLNAVGWNKVAAARTLGIDRATLYRKLLRFGLQGPSDAGLSRSLGTTAGQ